MRLVYWLVSFSAFSVGVDGFNNQRKGDSKQKVPDPCDRIAMKANYWEMQFKNATKGAKNESCSKDLEVLHDEYKNHLNISKNRIFELDIKLSEMNQELILNTKELGEMNIHTNENITRLEDTIISLKRSLKETESQKMGLTDQLNKKLENDPKCENVIRILTEQENDEKCLKDVEKSNNRIRADMKEQCNKQVEETKKLYASKPKENLGNICPKIESNDDTQCKNTLDSLRRNVKSITENLDAKEQERIEQELDMKILKHELKEIKESLNKTAVISEDLKSKDLEIQNLKNQIKNMTEILDSVEEERTVLEVVRKDLKNLQEVNESLRTEIAHSIALANKIAANVTECALPNLNSNSNQKEELESMRMKINDLKNDVRNKSDSISDLRTQFNEYKSKSYTETDKFHEMFLDEKMKRLKCEHGGQIVDTFFKKN